MAPRTVEFLTDVEGNWEYMASGTQSDSFPSVRCDHKETASIRPPGPLRVPEPRPVLGRRGRGTALRLLSFLCWRFRV